MSGTITTALIIHTVSDLLSSYLLIEGHSRSRVHTTGTMSGTTANAFSRCTVVITVVIGPVAFLFYVTWLRLLL